MKRFILSTVVIVIVALFSFVGGMYYEMERNTVSILAGEEGQEVFFQMQLQSMRDANGGYLGTYDE